MNENPAVLYQSVRSYRTIGSALISTFLLLFAALLAFSAFKSLNDKPIYFSLAIPAALLIRLAWVYVGGFFTNRKIQLKITSKGIEYGNLSIRWEDISKIYPYGGRNITGKKEYILCYELKNPKISRGGKFPLDKRLSLEEYNTLTDEIIEFIIPIHPQIKVKKP